MADSVPTDPSTSGDVGAAPGDAVVLAGEGVAEADAVAASDPSTSGDVGAAPGEAAVIAVEGVAGADAVAASGPSTSGDVGVAPGRAELRFVLPRGLRKEGAAIDAAHDAALANRVSGASALAEVGYVDPPPPMRETAPWQMGAWRADQQTAKERRRLVAEGGVRRLVHKYATRRRVADMGSQTATSSPDAAVRVPAPATVSPPATPEIALLRREMAVVKGQPGLLSALETTIKAGVKQRKRAEAGGRTSAGGLIKHYVFGGPSGTGKSSSIAALAKVLAAPEVNLLKKKEVVTLNKDTDTKSGSKTQPQVIREFFEKAEGGILFLDEVHQRPQAFAKALLTPLEDFNGKVMVVIAGYYDDVRDWLKRSDPGLPSRFQCRIEFVKLDVDTLVEIGMDRLADGGYSLDASAHDLFRRVMEHVHGRIEPCDLPLNGRGAKIAVGDMIFEHDARDDLETLDMCITTEDILTACPFAASPAPAPAPAPTPAPAPPEGVASANGKAAARAAPRRGSKSQTASSSAAAAGPLSAGAEATAGEEASPSAGPRAETPASTPGKRKRKDAGDFETLADAILGRYEVEDSGAERIGGVDFVRDVAPLTQGHLRKKLANIERINMVARELLEGTFAVINGRKGNGEIVQLTPDEGTNTQYVYGLKEK